jgi:hypothetical protein
MNPEAPEFFSIYQELYQQLPTEIFKLNPKTPNFTMTTGQNQNQNQQAGGNSNGMTKADASRIQSSQVS